jgi:peptidoglycan-N-acetylglucosamine deacetylase
MQRRVQADDQSTMSRRRALSLLAAAAALGVDSACTARIGASPDVRSSEPVPTSPTPPAAQSPSGPPASSVTASRPTGSAAGPTTSPATAAPARTLAQYVAQTPGTRPFPSNAIMLTIDDGPHPVWTPKILQLLHKYDVKAAFCIIGRSAAAHPELLRAAVSQGHHLANHSYSHPAGLAGLSASAIEAQLVDTQDAIVRATGFTPKQFRAPGGHWSPAMMRVAARQHLTVIDWDVDPRDWSRPGTDHIVHAMLAARPGDVLLCHDGGGDRSQTYAALKTVLPRLKARGLQFVTLP